jgi:beta-lactamase regulating signal transducer with metallopeptidase domain
MNVIGPMLDHPLAHRLGWALLHSVWEGALVGAVFAVVRLGLRRWSPNARYVAACTMLVVLVAAPVITILCMPEAAMPVSRARALAGRLLLNEPTAALRARVHPSGFAASTPHYLSRGTELLDRTLPWMVQLWVVGVIGLSCRWLHGSRWIRHVKTIDIEPVDPAWLLRVQDLCGRLNISRQVRLLKSALVEVPMVIGWLRPVILVPASALSGLTPDQLETILAHELAHVRRYDNLVNSFQNLVETLMFYHPAVWWISRSIREEREHCCDDLVLSVCEDRTTYVRALVSLEEARSFPRLALAATGGSLLHRVRRLLGVSNEDRPPSAVEFGGITLVAIGCVLTVAAIWLLNCPAIYQAAALIRVNPALALQNAATDATGSAGLYYPYFLQTECLVIRSPAVLDGVIRSLGLTETWSQRHKSGDKSAGAEALRLLKTRLSLQPVPSTSVIEIQASDSDPAEAARIANAVAASYKEYRLDQRRKSFRDALDMLEGRFSEQEQKVRKAQAAVDHLRVELKVPDAVVSENMPTLVSENTPTVILTAEALRHIEGLRIEGQAEYIKQKTLVDQLEKLDPKDLAATIPTIGVQDNQLAQYLDSLALADQKLIALEKELGPQHTEVVKAKAQQEDLREKVTARTSGILRGLQAKVAATGEGLASLSNAVVNAQDADVEASSKSRPYFAAKRDLEELVRFRQILQEKIAMENTDSQLPVDSVEVVEDAVAPLQAVAPNRPRAIALLGASVLLTLMGWLLTRADPADVGAALVA